MARSGTARADSGSGRTRLIHASSTARGRYTDVAAVSVQRLPSSSLGNRILRAETGGRIQAQTTGERPEFGSQTGPRLTNLPELRGFLSPGKPGRFARTAWWAMQGSNLRPLPCEGRNGATDPLYVTTSAFKTARKSAIFRYKLHYRAMATLRACVSYLLPS